jgi:prepilin-type N-terminal cleavage/methylation domain-containing protein
MERWRVKPIGSRPGLRSECEEPEQTLRSAFTLVELLVVIAIIALLAALLLPALSRAKEKSRAAICLNNGHQLLLSVHLYADDFNGWLPPNDDYHETAWVGGDLAEADGPTNIANLINPDYGKMGAYVGNYRIFRCPGDQSTWKDAGGHEFPRVRSYSMNAAVGTAGDATVPSQLFLNFNQPGTQGMGTWRTYGKLADMVLPSPANLWVILDEDQYSINDPFFVVIMRSANLMQMYNFPGSYHAFGAMFAYGDAHAEIHRWRDARTRNTSHFLIGGGQPDNHDIHWMQLRTSAEW